jgi:hypothetical protein
MTYEYEIASWRRKREKDLSEGIMIGDILWSPVPENERKDLKLNFYPINVDFKFDAKLTLLVAKKERVLSKEDGFACLLFLISKQMVIILASKILHVEKIVILMVGCY